LTFLPFSVSFGRLALLPRTIRHFVLFIPMSPFSKTAQGGSSIAVPEDRLPGTAVVTRKHPPATKYESATQWGSDRSKASSPMLIDQSGDEWMLTTSHDSRHSRLLSDVPEPPLLLTELHLGSAIPAASTNSPNNNLFGQDVCEFVNPASLPSPSPASHISVSSSQLLETSVSGLSNNPFSHHGITTESTTRLRTSPNQVFKTGEELALHYGIPTLLPPPPTQKKHQNQPPQSPPLDFNTLCSNYLSMISQNPSDDTMGADNAVPTPEDLLPTSHMETEQILEEWLTSSPQQWELLTSPIALGTPAQDFESSPIETPFSDFLTTPVFGHGADELPYSPAANSDLPLFGTDELFTAAPSSVKTKGAELPPELPYLLEMPPIPDNQVIDPSSIYPSPPAYTSHSSFPLAPTPSSSTTVTVSTTTARRRVTATGTRKNLNPEKLIPLDAPTQPRRYITPSATSRKEVPAVFLKKRPRVEMGDEEDELLEPLPANATEREQIEYKRRQNTLAARKSRKRKLIHQQELEDKVAHLNEEVTRWQTRCDVLGQMLQSHGISPPSFSD